MIAGTVIAHTKIIEEQQYVYLPESLCIQWVRKQIEIKIVHWKKSKVRIDRMSISEQVKELNWYASYQDYKKAQELMCKAADIIESLYAKLADIERSKERNKKMLRYGFCPDCGAPGGRDASSCFECGAVLDWDLIKDMERTADDCGGGWISCKDRLPETRNNILVCQSDGYVSVGYYSCDRAFLDLNSIPFDDVIAWRELPEPYHEP